MRTFVLPVLVGFGDCDPAGIVFYPNFFRWFDLAAHEMFRAAGYDVVRAEREQGLIVGALVDAGATFKAPATQGDRIEVHSWISDWKPKTFRIAHQIRKDGVLLVDGFEVRIAARTDPQDPPKLRIVPIPDDFRQLFDTP